MWLRWGQGRALCPIVGRRPRDLRASAFGDGSVWSVRTSPEGQGGQAPLVHQGLLGPGPQGTHGGLPGQGAGEMHSMKGSWGLLGLSGSCQRNGALASQPAGHSELTGVCVHSWAAGNTTRPQRHRPPPQRAQEGAVAPAGVRRPLGGLPCLPPCSFIPTGLAHTGHSADAPVNG